MQFDQFSSETDSRARRVVHDDGTEFVVDLGRSVGDSPVDVVDGTVIVVIGDDQYEFDCPSDVNEASAFIHNGVLTIEVEGDR